MHQAGIFTEDGGVAQEAEVVQEAGKALRQVEPVDPGCGVWLIELNEQELEEYDKHGYVSGMIGSLRFEVEEP